MAENDLPTRVTRLEEQMIALNNRVDARVADTDRRLEEAAKSRKALHGKVDKLTHMVASLNTTAHIVSNVSGRSMGLVGRLLVYVLLGAIAAGLWLGESVKRLVGG